MYILRADTFLSPVGDIRPPVHLQVLDSLNPPVQPSLRRSASTITGLIITLLVGWESTLATVVVGLAAIVQTIERGLYYGVSGIW